MKYEVELTRTRNVTKSVSVEADSARAAIEAASKGGLVPEDYSIEAVTEIHGDDTEGSSELYMGRCEFCDTIIMENDEYAANDDGRFCKACCDRYGEEE